MIITQSRRSPGTTMPLDTAAHLATTCNAQEQMPTSADTRHMKAPTQQTPKLTHAMQMSALTKGHTAATNAGMPTLPGITQALRSSRQHRFTVRVLKGQHRLVCYPS